MDTEVIGIDPQVGEAEAARHAAEVVTHGGLAAFPTETVYGLAARADDREAVQRLRDVKSRGADQAFTVHIGSAADAARFAPELAGLATRFIRKAWPGPLTLVVRVDDPSAAPVMAGLNGSAAAAMYYQNTIGLRCPDEPVAQALLQAVEAPVVAASANLAGRPPPWTARDVLQQLRGRIDLLVDGGQTRYAKPSTIVRVTGSSYELLREGVYDAGIVERLSTLRLLLVCTGSTCRSPMAAALAKKMLAERVGCRPEELSARGIVVESAGTAGGGSGASPNALAVMARRSIDLSEHIPAALSPEMVQRADYVFVMTRSHRDTVVGMAPLAADRVALLLDDQDIHDPLGGSEDEYERCAQTLEQGLQARLQEVIV